MASTNGQSAHSRLLALERNTAPDSDSITELAELLSVDFGKLRNGLLDPSVILERIPPVFAPKEEWALRWLLKKAIPQSHDPRMWLLVYYLVPRTPVKQVAKLLRDHIGMQWMEAALARIPFGVTLNLLEPQCENVQVFQAILQTICFCLEAVDQQQMRLAMSLPPLVTASILGLLIKLSLRLWRHSVLSKETPESVKSRELLAHSLVTLTQLWDLKEGPELGETANDTNKAFTVHCLKPCLIFVGTFDKPENLGEAVTKLKAFCERCISDHTISPARNLFFAELAQTHSIDQDPLLPIHTGPLVTRLHDHFFPEGLKDSADNEIKNAFATELFRIGLDSTQTRSLREEQRVQPWIEALLTYLAHLGYQPSVQQMHNESYSSIESDSSESRSRLAQLLRLLRRQGKSVSMQVASYFFEYFVKVDMGEYYASILMDEILLLGLNHLLPNSGISRAPSQLIRLWNSLDAAHVSDSCTAEREIWLHVFTHLMQIFASGRSIEAFLTMWLAKLRESGEVKSLWDCDDAIAIAIPILKSSTSPDIIDAYAITTVKALEEDKFDDSQYAQVFALDLLIQVHEEHDLKVKDITASMSDTIHSVIAEDKAQGKLAGWLWRLYRHLIPSLERPTVSRFFHETFENQNESVIASTWHNANPSSDTFDSVKASRDFERLRWFMTAITVLRPSGASILVAQEVLGYLQCLVDFKLTDTVTRPPYGPWESQLVYKFADRGTFIWALGGLWLEHPSILCFDITDLIALLRGLYDFHQDSCFREDSLLQALLHDDRIVSTPGFVKACFDLMDSPKNDDSPLSPMYIIQQLPKEAMSKAQRKRLGTWQDQQRSFAPKRARTTTPSEVPQQSQETPASESVSTLAWNNRKIQTSCKQSLERATLGSTKPTGELESMICRTDLNEKDLVFIGSTLYKGHADGSDISRTAAHLSNLISKSQNLACFCLTIDCILIILNKHASAVNQWTIDNLLSGIVATLSPTGPNLPDPPIIYERLCRLLGTILSRYRIRLGGRFHLLLPVLYGLLRSLFSVSPSSFANKSQRAFHARLPPWIRSSSTGLPKASATQLTRLISSIADPSPAAVVKRSKSQSQSQSHKSSLTDETRRTRQTAGEYMQYFVAEYTRCSLQGSIVPEVKDALVPGLYVVLDGMGAEVMRAMNARLDASQKAIWRALYDDWMRFGKWNGV